MMHFVYLYFISVYQIPSKSVDNILILDRINDIFNQYKEKAIYMQGEVDETIHYNSKYELYTKYRFKQNQNSRLLEQQITSPNGHVSHIVHVFNTKYGFTLSRNSSSASIQYVLVATYPGVDHSVNKEIASTISRFTTYPVRAYVQSKPSLKLNIEERSDGQYVIIHHDDKTSNSTGWAKHDKHNGLFISERHIRNYMKTGSGRGIWNISEIHYEYINKDGSMLPLKIVRTDSTEGVPNDTRSREMLYRVHYDQNVPDEDFTLSAFGMLEPYGITWERPRPWWIYFGLAGGGCLVGIVLIGVFLRRRYGAS